MIETIIKLDVKTMFSNYNPNKTLYSRGWNVGKKTVGKPIEWKPPSGFRGAINVLWESCYD